MARIALPQASTSTSAVDGLPLRGFSRFLGIFRPLFMPLGMLALLAVGVHAAADALDDRILWVVDRLDAWLDAVFAQWSLTEPLVNLLEPTGATRLARALAFAWEIAAGVLIAIPALGYREQAPGPARALPFSDRPQSWGALALEAVRHPTVMRLTRPVFALAFAVAGASAAARLAQGELTLTLRAVPLDDEWAGPLGRLAAVLSLLLVVSTLGWRAVLRSLEHADRVSDEASRASGRSVRVGLWGALVLAPLAWVAALDASFLVSFFR